MESVEAVETKRSYRSLKGLFKRCRCARRSWEGCSHPWFFTIQARPAAGGPSIRDRGCLHTANKKEADAKRTEIEAQMKAGTYVPKKRVEPQAGPTVNESPSFGTVADFYLKQYMEAEITRKRSGARRKLSDSAIAHHHSVVKFLGTVVVPPGVPFTDKPFRLITQEDIELALAAKRQPSTTTITRGDHTWPRASGGDVAANRMHAHLSSIWSWATARKRGYATQTPFRDGEKVPDELRKTKERGRDRRLRPGEEEALLQHAGPHLRDCIVALLETGCRKGELLALQWQDVRWLQNELAIRWENTKTEHAREIPISPVLRKLLVTRKAAHPKGHEWKPTDYVFGDEAGRRVKDIRTAWDNTVLKAHGVKVVRGHRGRVSAENRARLRQINLHVHDLRHEAGSRKFEVDRWPLHAISHWLGHTKLATTDTYLNATKRLLHELNERVPLTLVR